MTDPVTMLIVGIAFLILSIPTNSYGLAGLSVALLFWSGVLYSL